MQNYIAHDATPKVVRDNGTILCLFRIVDTKTLDKEAAGLIGPGSSSRRTTPPPHKHNFFMREFSPKVEHLALRQIGTPTCSCHPPKILA